MCYLFCLSQHLHKAFCLSICPWGLWGNSVVLKIHFTGKVSKSKELNGGPLSESSLSGILCIVNTFLSLSHVILHEVDVDCSTTGYLVCLSMITILWWGKVHRNQQTMYANQSLVCLMVSLVPVCVKWCLSDIQSILIPLPRPCC